MDKQFQQPQPRIRELRKKAGYTQEALAKELGVSKRTVWNLENGKTLPNLAMVFLIAGILGVAWHLLYAAKGGEEHADGNEKTGAGN